jgi:TorA maturation chaperone TorD
MNIADLLKYEKARGSAYKGLAECYQMPGNGLYQTLIELERKLELLCSGASPYIASMRREWIGLGNEINELCVDYARLFVGPYALLAPPYGSVYLDRERQVMGNSTMDVCTRYEEAGLELAGHFKEPPDHIAAELEFLYFLIFKALDAAEHADMESFSRYLEKRKHFLSDHLGAWISDFQWNVEEKAETNFYKNLARATGAIIQKDLDELVVYTADSGQPVQ